MKAHQLSLKRIKMVDPLSQEEVKTPSGDPVYFRYRSQLWQLLSGVEQGKSLSTDEMMERSRVQFLLQESKDDQDLFLDEKQYEILKKTVNETKWTAVSPFIASLIEDVRNAPEVELEPKKDVATAQ